MEWVSSRSLMSTFTSHLSPVGGPGYSALIFDNVTAVTSNGMKKAMSFAQAGLPVVFVGQLPSSSPYYSESKGDVTAIVDAMLKVCPRFRIENTATDKILLSNSSRPSTE